MKLAAGALLADRYRLDAVLGEGIGGRVWRATDTVSGRVVALKLRAADAGRAVARLRREATVMRVLRAPGIARLYDEGRVGEWRFIAMQLVEGRPFPNPEPDRVDSPALEWRAISGPTRGLLETLVAVHARGWVHRDLKPGNVLIADGRPYLLDFAVARGVPGDALSLDEPAMVGTPSYQAPEQLRGHPVDARADLYAVGVLLFAALAGRLPHPDRALPALMRDRLLRPAPSLALYAPGVPRALVGLVDRLLARAPLDRPGSAGEVLALLDAFDPPRPLPWLGSTAVVDQTVERVRAGHSVQLVGPPGSGRSRCLAHVADRLGSGAGDADIVWTQPGTLPFDSLRGLLGASSATDPDPPAYLAARRVELQARMMAGAVVLVDEPAVLDPWSRAALESLRSAGVVVERASMEAAKGPPDTLRVRPLRVGDLEGLFAPHPDVEAVAAALHARTAGWPGRVAQVVSRWRRAGWIRPVDGDERFELAADAGAAIEASQPLAFPLDGPEIPDAVRPTWHAVDLLGWATAAEVAAVTEAQASVLAPHLAWLLHHGWLVEQATPAGPRLRCTAGRPWPPLSAEARRDLLRRVIAHRPVGAPGRLELLWGLGREVEPAELSAEALAAAERRGAASGWSALRQTLLRVGDDRSSASELLAAMRAHPLGPAARVELDHLAARFGSPA